MATPLYDLQKIKEALEFTDVHVPTAQEVQKIKNEQFSTFPTADKGNGSNLPSARSDKNFNEQFFDGPRRETLAIRDAVIRKGSIFFARDEQGIKAENANQSVVEGITFDLILSEHHELSAVVCSHPVQNGSAVTDHVQPQPTKGSFQVLVTEYSIKDGNGGWRGDTFDPSASRAKRVWESFKSVFANKMLCNLVLVLDVYYDVVLTRVSAMRDGMSGEAQVFDVEFTQIRRADLATAPLKVTAKPANMLDNKNRKASGPVANGPTVPEDLDPSTEDTFE